MKSVRVAGFQSLFAENDMNKTTLQCPERDGDDYWDLIEADGKECNDAGGTSLFARVVVPEYRLAVFRKASTLNHSTTTNDTEHLSVVAAAATTNGRSGSPSPTDKERQGRTAARHPAH